MRLPLFIVNLGLKNVEILFFLISDKLNHIVFYLKIKNIFKKIIFY